MANPKISTLTDVFLPDGFGAFGYGAGGFGGAYDLLNPQWNTDSGLYYVDTNTGLPAIEATSTPSYVGASLYDATYSSFFAKITPATGGGGGYKTALVIQKDVNNFVEISVGPNGIFSAYGVNDNNVVYTASSTPTYDPTAHAFWRIRNDDAAYFNFDVSPDAVTWTNLGSVPYTWDAKSVSVVFLAGFSGYENAGTVALISNINVVPGLSLSAKTYDSASVNASAAATSALPLTGRVNGQANLRGRFTASLGIPQGGVTDFSFSAGIGTTTLDPAQSVYRGGFADLAWTGGHGFGTALWNYFSYNSTAPNYYRDGSYWPVANYMSPASRAFFAGGTANSAPNVMSGVETTIAGGLKNRLPINASIYLTSCAYTGNQVGNSMSRSTDFALNGQYSGKLTYGPSNATIGTGQTAYWCFPTFSSMVPVHNDGAGTYEGFTASVWLSTARAGTQWFASLVYYDLNWNVISGSGATTYTQATITNMNTHPGGNAWQQGTVQQASSPSNAVYVAVVPVIIAPSPQVKESVYISNHSITTMNFNITDADPKGTYQEPNTQIVTVKPDRLNYMMNSGFPTGLGDWATFLLGVSGSPLPTSNSWDSVVGHQVQGSMKVTVVTPSGTFAGGSGARIGPGTYAYYPGSGNNNPNIEGLKPGHTYTFSAWVLQGPNCPDVYMKISDANFVGTNYISVNAAKANPANIDAGGWVRVSTTYTIPPNTGPTFQIWFSNLVSDVFAFAPFNYWVDDILVEEGIQLLPYFDGNTGGSDYQWETNPINNLFGRSFFYKDYINKTNRLNTAINQVLPVGSNVIFKYNQSPTYP